MNTIVYKGVEIVKTDSGYYKFSYNGIEHINTNLYFAKIMITRVLKANQ